MSTTQEIALDEIIVDPELQSRVSYSEAAIEEYSAALRLGVLFPPIKVYRRGTQLVLIDGYHRLRAHQALGLTTITCEILDCSHSEALKLAAGSNSSHGLRRTNADKRRCVEMLLADPSLHGLSDQEIANIAVVDRSFVGRVRSSLGIIPSEASTEQIRQVRKQDGTTYPMKVQRIGQTRKAIIEEQAMRESEDSEPEDLSEMADLISQLETENKTLKDAIAIGQWDATEIERIDMKERFESLREEIRVLQIENESLRKSCGMYQRENSELIRSIKSYQRKLKELNR